MYIAEIAPATIRGRLVSVNQLTIVVGILLGAIRELVDRATPAVRREDEFIGQVLVRVRRMALDVRADGACRRCCFFSACSPCPRVPVGWP